MKILKGTEINSAVTRFAEHVIALDVIINGMIHGVLCSQVNTIGVMDIDILIDIAVEYIAT